MLSYLLTLALPSAGAAALYSDHAGILLSVLVLVLPIVDVILGRDTPPKVGHWTEAVVFYLPHAFLTLWLAFLYVAGSKLGSGSGLNDLLILVDVGIMGAFASVHGHEFMHRDCEHSRRAANITFAMLGYGHYPVSHLIHHTKPGDQHFGSSPARGMSVWSHLPVSMKNGFAAAWRSELRRSGQKLLRNVVVQQAVLSLAVAGACIWFWGASGLALFLGQALLSMVFIETAGYIQHYGLVRLPNQPITRDLAWDGDFWLSNRLLINNPYHAHHHRAPMKVFSQLQAAAPTLPLGYLAMIWIALVPPAWFAIMDKKLDRILESQHAH